MAQETKTRIDKRDLPSLSRRALIEPKTISEEKRTVEVVWATASARVLRGFFDRYQEELSLDPKHVRMGRLESGAPLLDAHDLGRNQSVIGVVESARLENGRGIATVRFASEGVDPNADAIWRKIKDGIIRGVSVGYSVRRLEKIEEEDNKIPVYRATDWEPFEISVVPVGADAAAQVRAGVPTNSCEFISQEERQMPNPTDQGAAATAAATPPPVDEVKIRREAAESERKRQEDIRNSARHAGLEGDPFVAELLRSDVSPGEAASKILAEQAKRKESTGPSTQPAGTGIEMGATDREKFLRGAEHWLYERAGVADLIVEHAKKKGETLKLDGGELRGMTMLRLAEESLRRQGVKLRSMDPRDIIGQALSYRSGYQSTSDFPVLLENALNKTLLAAYATSPDTWRTFCKVGSVSDFRAHNRYRQGTFGVLDKVLENGEFTNKAIPDGKKETITAATYGNIIAISRQALINDDMGAFMDLASRLGRAAGLSVEVAVYALIKLQSGTGPNMSDGQPLWDDTAHANVSTGAAISMAALDLDRVKMASQTDPSGNEILDLRPRILVLPIALGGTARTINEAQYDPDTANKLQKPNNVRGMFSAIVDTPRLTGTKRYLFADPSVAPAIEVAFLNGQQTPFMESQEGWRTDGSEWKIRLDYAVAAVDWRGTVMNAGV